MVDEDSLLQFVNISTQGINKSDSILMLSSPLDDIIRHAWRVSQIQQFRITDLGISIEFCPNCYKTHTHQHRSFNLFVHTSMLHTCVSFICKNTRAVAIEEAFDSFITIYRIPDHQCPTSTPPNTPPPPSPTRPVIPSRDHPRFGYLRGPRAKPFAKFSDLSSPYRITNSIVINEDGSVKQVSTVLGHCRSISNCNLLTPPRKCNNAQQPKSEKLQLPVQQRINLHRNTSIKLLPPKQIKRTQIPLKNIPKHSPTYPKVDMNVDNEEDYVVFEDYIQMSSRYSETLPQLPPIVGDHQMRPRNLEISSQLSDTVGDHMPSHDRDQKNISVQNINEFSRTTTHAIVSNNGSHSVSVDLTREPDSTDHDYFNIQNILIELDKSTPKSHKPPIKKRTIKFIKSGVDVNAALASNQPKCVPRKSSPASPKPIPRKRSIMLDHSMLPKEEGKDDTHDTNDTSKAIDDLTTQLRHQSKLQSSPNLPIRNTPNIAGCDISFAAESSNLVNDDSTSLTHQSHFPLG